MEFNSFSWVRVRVAVGFEEHMMVRKGEKRFRQSVTVWSALISGEMFLDDIIVSQLLCLAAIRLFKEPLSI